MATYFLPDSWTTFQGKEVSLDTIDHQHMSNVYWFLRIVHNTPKEALADIQKKMDERFNGQLLPYRPHVKFEQEIQFLKEKGMLSEIHESHYAIIWNGEIVGEIWTLENI